MKTRFVKLSEYVAILFLEFINSLVGFLLVEFMGFVNIFCKTNRHDIIIIRRDRIGDFILWMGCAQQLRNFYRDRHITLICSSFNLSIVNTTKIFDEVICISRLRDVLKLRAISCELLIDPTQSRYASDIHIAKLIKCPRKVANRGDDVNLFLLDHKAALKKTYNKVILCSETPTPELTTNTLFYNALTQSRATELYADLTNIYEKPGFDCDYFVVNIGASSATRQWPVERFAYVCNKIYTSKKLKLVLIGSSKEVDLSERFCKLYRGTYIDTTGQTNIKDMISILAYAQFVLCNDTSTVHICAALDVKCFCIAPRHFDRRFNCYPQKSGDRRKNLPIYITAKEVPCAGCAFFRDLSKKRLECILNQIVYKSQWKCIKDISAQMVWQIIQSDLQG